MDLTVRILVDTESEAPCLMGKCTEKVADWKRRSCRSALSIQHNPRCSFFLSKNSLIYTRRIEYGYNRIIRMESKFTYAFRNVFVPLSVGETV